MNAVRAIQSFFGPGVHPIFLGFTGLGTSAALWAVLFLYSWLADPRFARRLGVVFAASILANHALKLAFGTQRPYELDSTLATDSARRTGGGAGFPSGHSMNAATFYLGLAFYYRHHRRALLLWLAALLLTIGVGLSRLYLGVHLPEDVGGGFVFGALFAWVAGAWTVPLDWPRRRLWAPFAMVAGLGLAFLGVDPLPCGLLVGALIAQGDFTPPQTAKGRALIVAGGLVLLTLLAGLLLWALERLWPGFTKTVPVTFFSYLALAWVGLEGWPRWFGRMRSEAKDAPAGRTLTPPTPSLPASPPPAGREGA
jgi:membrane-associated phospholipid phosphatase